MRPLVIYHDACRDGFCAAWCVWRALPDCEFVAAQYGREPPDVAGRDVVMVDFSYPRETMQRIADSCDSLIVLDHHKTAEAELKDFSHPKAEVTFDMQRSGAGLAWDYFHVGKRRPWIVDYVEDRDLWRFSLPHSKTVNAWLATLPFQFLDWEAATGRAATEAKLLGSGVEALIELHVASAVKHARRVTIDGHDVPILNVTTDISEVVGKLAENESFAVGWFQLADGSFVYSLRSRGDFDVSEVAKRRGGGGHKNAAGFKSEVLL